MDTVEMDGGRGLIQHWSRSELATKNRLETPDQTEPIDFAQGKIREKLPTGNRLSANKCVPMYAKHQ